MEYIHQLKERLPKWIKPNKNKTQAYVVYKKPT